VVLLRKIFPQKSYLNSAVYHGVMSDMKFKYFRDPDNFAFKVDEASACSICGKKGLWFEAGGFYGENEIDCICDECLIDGRLEELGIETNEAFGGDDEETRIIIYKTPALPTWQDRVWPHINGEYCVFERMASKADFESKGEFINSFSAQDKENSDLYWLWEILPEKRIANHLEGNFNISVYLFTCHGQKLCTWDAS
jgi:Uncharacterized protein conserved in bacteria